MAFRDREKARYELVKPQLFSSEAQHPGNYRNLPRPFCLADDHASENLYTDFRTAAIQYFQQRSIPWHDGLNARSEPSNHLCCSQSCCVNFLYPMVSDPNLAKAVFKSFYPDLQEVLAIDKDQSLSDGTLPYMAFEWIGSKDFLREARRKGASRTRGANATSADFAFRFLRQDGQKQFVLGEWKYTEEYGEHDKGIPARKENYLDAFNRGELASKGEGLYEALFFEPFYQLMRQQLLAQEMETGDQGREMECDIVTVLHISPTANREFREKDTSPYLRQAFPGEGPLDIWGQLAPKNRFLSISVEELLNTIIQEASSAYPEWVKYLNIRYRF